MTFSVKVDEESYSRETFLPPDNLCGVKAAVGCFFEDTVEDFLVYLLEDESISKFLFPLVKRAIPLAISIIYAKVSDFRKLSVAERARFLDYLADFVTSEMNFDFTYTVQDVAEDCLKEKIQNLNSDVFGLILENVAEQFESWRDLELFEKMSSEEVEEETDNLNENKENS